MVNYKLIEEIQSFETMFPERLNYHVYLAGPMQKSPDGGVKWRKELQEYLLEKNISCFNPCTKISQNNEHTLFDILKQDKFDIDVVREITNDIIIEDIAEVLTTDLIVCNWENDYISSGTSGELTIAKIFNIPVIMITDDVYNVPAWAIGCTDLIKKDFENIDKDIIKMLDKGE